MLTKEKLDSWYEPKTLAVKCECLSEEEELVAEDKCKDCGKVECMCYEDAIENQN